MGRPKAAAVEEEKGECAPLWIISFADMISLLMAFFVMLLTMSTARSGKLCNEGEGVFERTLYGFRRSIEGFGMPGLFGDADEGLYFDSPKVHYPIEEGADPMRPRTIDAAEERIRRDFRKLEGRTRTYEAQIQGRSPDFLVLPVTFAQGQSVLSEAAQRQLNSFLEDLKGFRSVEGLNLYVVGLAPMGRTRSGSGCSPSGRTRRPSSCAAAPRKPEPRVLLGSGHRRGLGEEGQPPFGPGAACHRDPPAERLTFHPCQLFRHDAHSSVMTSANSDQEGKLGASAGPPYSAQICTLCCVVYQRRESGFRVPVAPGERRMDCARFANPSRRRAERGERRPRSSPRDSPSRAILACPRPNLSLGNGESFLK
jgi:hypothetical protein